MSSLRRLAKDHAQLRASLPPNYLFLSTDDADSLPDDLTQLLIHLTGSEGTPYSLGLWLLHLRIPPDYPKSPPKATFKTRIFHPNVEESTGAVCLETLKRDWDPKLTLKDILVTISCLLIQPNPDSALNEKAGVLVREDYEGFLRQARLMTKIHAPVPMTLKEVVDEARRRGEDDGSVKTSKVKNKTAASVIVREAREKVVKSTVVEVSSSDESVDCTKENDPSRVSNMPQVGGITLKKHVLGKRPLTELASALESEDSTVLVPTQPSSQTESGEPPRKSPKHTYHSQANGREATPSTIDIDDHQSIVLDLLDAAASRSIKTGMSKPPTKSKYRPYARIGIKRL